MKGLSGGHVNTVAPYKPPDYTTQSQPNKCPATTLAQAMVTITRCNRAARIPIGWYKGSRPRISTEPGADGAPGL